MVGVADRDLTDAGRRQELRRGRAQAAHADDERVRGHKSLLRVRPEFVEQDVPAVAKKLGIVHEALLYPRSRTKWPGPRRSTAGDTLHHVHRRSTMRLR